MTRFSYFLLVAICVGLATYVFWPAAPEVDSVERVWSGEILPSEFRVQVEDLVQEVHGETVTLHGLERVLDPERNEGLWRRIRTLCALKKHIEREVEESRLPGYGLDGRRRLDCETLALRWGPGSKGGFLWEGRSRRLFAVDQETIAALDQASDRLDARALFPKHASLNRMICGNGSLPFATLQPSPAIGASMPAGWTVELAVSDGHWRDVARPERPHFDARIGTLLTLVGSVALERFTVAVPSDARMVGEVVLTAEDGARHRVTVLGLAERGWLRLDSLPPQELDAVGLAAWRMCLEDLRHDMIFDILRHAQESPLVEVQVTKAEKSIFRLEKHGINDVDREGRSQWDVVWPTGREAASDDAAAVLAQNCDRLYIADATPRGSAVDPHDAIAIDFVFNVRHDRVRVLLVPVEGGWEAWSATHRGRIIAPPKLLTAPSVDACLDTALSHRPAFRVVKVQRRGEDGAPGEVFSSEGGKGAWRRTFPLTLAGQPVNQLAVDRLVRALCTARGLSARQVNADDRALLAQANFEISLRFAPRFAGRSDDSARIGDTTDQDWTVIFARDADGWRALDRDAGVSWRLADELVEILRQPLNDDLAFPIMASLVRSVEISGRSGHYRLSAEGDGWSLTRLDGAPETQSTSLADATEVRRFLRQLAGLRAQRSDPTATIEAGATEGTVVCELPDLGDQRAQAMLIIGRAVGDLVPVMPATSRADRHLGNGVVWLTAADAATLLPPPTAFSGVSR